jgi:amino acid permease
VKQDRFFKTIGITGGIAMTLEGILIVLMFNKAKKLGERKPEYSVKANKIVSALLILIFLLGMIYTILEFFGVL